MDCHELEIMVIALMAYECEHRGDFISYRRTALHRAVFFDGFASILSGIATVFDSVAACW